MNNKILLISGFGAGLLYLLADIIGGLLTPNYSYIRNAVSELIQSGAKHRATLSPFMFAHAVMIIIFAISLMAGFPYTENKLVFIGAALLLLVGISHALSSTIFPMDPVGTEPTFAGTMHLVLVGITVLAIFVLMPLLAIGLKPVISWSAYTSFTFICLAVLIISGFSSPVIIAKGIPVMGLTERITGYVFYVWMAIVGFLLV